MDYIDKIIASYEKNFKVNTSLIFVRNNGQMVKIETLNVNNNYYLRIYKECLGEFFSIESETLISNTLDKNYLKKAVIRNILHLSE